MSTTACPGLSATLKYMATDGNNIENLKQFGNFAQAELDRSKLLALACIEVLGVDGMQGADPAAEAVAARYNQLDRKTMR